MGRREDGVVAIKNVGGGRYWGWIGDGVGSGLNGRWGVSPQAELGRVWIVGKDFYLLTTLHFPHFIHYFILLLKTYNLTFRI